MICLISLRAESARAVTGRQCPHGGVGEDFLARRPFLDALASLNTMLDIKSLMSSRLQSITEYCRVLQSIAEHCRVLQSVAEC